MSATLSVHRQILKQAWLITWRNKWLWFLGLLAAFWANNGVYQIFTSSFKTVGGKENLGPGFWQRVETFSQANTAFSPWGMVFLVLFAAVLAFIIWLGTAGRGGLIFTANELAENKKVTNREALNHGTAHFLKIFIISLAGKILCASFLLCLGCLVLKSSSWNSLWGIPIFILGFLVFALLTIIVSFIIVYSLCFMLLYKIGLGQSVKKAFSLFAKNWLVGVEMALILYILGIVLGLALLAVAFTISMPIFLLFIILLLLNIPMGLWIVAVPTIIVFAAALIIVGSAFSFFQMTAWILLFRRLTGEGALAKLVRIFHRKK